MGELWESSGTTYVALLQAHGQTAPLNHHRDESSWMLFVFSPVECCSSVDDLQECDCGAGKLGSSRPSRSCQAKF